MYLGEDIDDILAELTELTAENDVHRIRKTLTKIQTLANAGTDTQTLFPAVVKHLASTDLLTKKLACWFVCHHGNQRELILLAINTLVKDCSDANPMIRGLALRTLSQLPQPALLEYWIQPLQDCLKDISAYVRRVAVIACAKLHHLDPTTVVDHNLVDTLYSMVRDSDPIVVVNCLSTLEDILKEEGGVVVNKPMAHYLINKLKMFSDWNLVTVLQVLKRYRPKTEEEGLDIMNLVDAYLKHGNSAVVVSVVEYFLHLAEAMPHLKLEVYSRGKGQLLHCMNVGSPELTLVLLEYMDTLLQVDPSMLSAHHKYFFCKYNEPVYVKVKKLKTLPVIVSEENIGEILEELGLNCMDLNARVTCTAVDAVGKVAQRFPQSSDKCVQKLLDLLDFQEEQVICEVLKVLQGIDFHKNGYLEKTMVRVEKCVSTVESEEGKCAMLWLIGEHGDHLDSSPYLLETLAEGLEEDTGRELQLSLLGACVKLFMKRPAECQDILGHALSVCVHSSEADVRDRALFYYQLLRLDVEEARKVIIANTTKVTVS